MTIDTGIAAIIGGIVTKIVDSMLTARNKKNDEIASFRSELTEQLRRADAELEVCRTDRAELRGKLVAVEAQMEFLRAQLEDLKKRQAVVDVGSQTNLVG